MKKSIYFLLFASYITAVVLIFLDKINKPVIEGLTVALLVLSMIGLYFLYKSNNFKNNLLFEIVNIIVCALSFALLIMFVRDDSISKSTNTNVGYLVVLSLSVFLSLLILLDDLLDLVPGTGAKVKKSS